MKINKIIKESDRFKCNRKCLDQKSSKFYYQTIYF